MLYHFYVEIRNPGDARQYAAMDGFVAIEGELTQQRYPEVKRTIWNQLYKDTLPAWSSFLRMQICSLTLLTPGGQHE